MHRHQADPKATPPAAFTGVASRAPLGAALVGLLLAGAGLLGAPAAAQERSTTEAVRIGVVLDRTGPASALGEGEANTLELLQRALEGQGGVDGVPVEFTLVDSGSSVGGAVEAVERLIEEDRVHALLCCTLSQASMAVVAPVMAAGVPTISLAAAAPIARPAAMRFWVFQAAQSDALMARGILADMVERGITDVSVLALSDAFGESGLVELQAALDRSDVRLHRVVRYDRDAESFNAPALAALLDRPQAVVVWGIAEDSARMVRALRERGFGGDIYLSHGVGAPAFLELAGEAAEGVRLPIGPAVVADQLAASHPVREVALAYRTAYEEAYGVGRLTSFGAHVHDAVGMLAQAVAHARAAGDLDLSDVTAARSAIRSALEEMEPYVGAGGVFDYSGSDHTGLDERAYVIVEVRGGAWRLAN